MAKIRGTQNNDELIGFAGNDRILGFGGRDHLFGNQGNDLLIGHGGNDELHGGPGRDRLQGRAGKDLLFGDEDDDVLIGHGGNDELQGGPGIDRLQGGGGRDLLLGGEGDDTLRGNGGIDELQGGPGGDRLEGGGGNDTLFGGAGNDTLAGGGGADEFVVESIADGLDDILDFDMAEYDFLTVSTALTGFESGNDIDRFVRVDPMVGVTLVSLNPDGAGDDFTPVFRLTGEFDSNSLVSYGMEFDRINPDLLPLQSNPSLSTDDPASSTSPDISADGRFVAFESKDFALGSSFEQDFEDDADIFVADFASGMVARASTDAAGGLAGFDGGSDAFSFAPSISSDGRLVAFHSGADNLVTNDTNDSDDIFIKDLLTGAIVRASTASNGQQGDASSSNASLSDDGRLLAFESEAANLVATDPNGAGNDVFVKDLGTGEIDRIAAPDGTIAHNPTLSGDGHFLAFETSDAAGGSSANVVLVDLATGASRIVAATSDGSGSFSGAEPVLSSDGRFLAFASEVQLTTDDDNGESDIFVFDRLLGTTEMVSTSSTGSGASGSDDVFQQLSSSPSISADGRYVAFDSAAVDLVPGDTNGLRDVFVKDMATGAIHRVSLNPDGSQATGGLEASELGSRDPSISADGRLVAYASNAGSLQGVPNDDAGTTVFLAETGFGSAGPAALETLLTPAESGVG
jgi:Tol biopolymer transport system component